MRYHELEHHREEDFIQRHIGPAAHDIEAMLKIIGFDSLDRMTDAILPKSIHMSKALEVCPPASEDSLLHIMKKFAGQNRVLKSLIGQGYYGTITPPVLQRNILENPAWYTAYTPYQPEISQGRLEALLNFQTMICDLTGFDMANASLLDEATAAAEAMAVARRVSKSQSNVFFVDENCHAQVIEVIKTRAEPLGWQVKMGDPQSLLSASDYFGVVLAYPGTDGHIAEVKAPIEAVKASGGFVIMACDLLSLALLVPPGELGADMAIGSAQRFGVPMGYGGPHAAFMATTDAHKRMLPGRIIGVSIDSQGKPAYRLSLQTREQHIRREKATSNICTAQALLAIMASMYAVWHGPDGLYHIAARTHRLAKIFATGLAENGYQVSDRFFDTVLIETDKAAQIAGRAIKAGFNLRQTRKGLTLSFDETCDANTVLAVWQLFDVTADFTQIDDQLDAQTLPEEMRRRSDYLTHPVFHLYRSETEMMRYLRRLSDKDLALDRTMIPLGSCTMKLNAAAEMMPVTWPEFANMHPFCPADQAAGYIVMIEELKDWLCTITGYDAISMQPNSGAQGEYAGLLAIRSYLKSRGEADRTICLIAASAHGTNPASAQMAGMQVVVVACDENGNIDLADLREKIDQHKDKLAAMMVTYPSTHGVFEKDITTICDWVHSAGGQVYLDGANLNAQVGLAQPGKYGADVSHLNLHKTFCIPHGGGGPGMGPIGVGAHLAPFLPHHDFEPGQDAAAASGQIQTGQIAAAPFGSPLILPISYSYIRMMGSDGLRKASQIAILNANYIAAELACDYEVLYAGETGHVAHEVILDIRPLKQAAGIDAEDIAKRLMDYGFHAPTMSFPVAGTLMIEPTESECRAELDRFIQAMKSIRTEIRQVEQGKWPAEDNPLVNAPHTAEMVMAETWTHPYDRHLAGMPAGQVNIDKYWPPVARIDNVFGDRNLVCTCPPLSEYAEVAE